MKIYYDNTFLDIDVEDSSYRYRTIKGEHALTLCFSLPRHIELPVGAYCDFQNERYTLERPENFKMHNSRNFEYTVILEASQAKLEKYKFRNTVDRRLKFSLTAKPEEHLRMLIDNLNKRDSGWTTGTHVDTVEKCISYNHTSCKAALGQMADAFDTEWEIVGKTISLHKVEYNKSNPLPLSYGKGNGFKPGVGRSNFNESRPAEILYTEGGTQNIDPGKYRNPELLLPKSQTLVYQGRTYVTDEDGLSMRRADKPLRTQSEESLDCSHIYPNWEHTVTAVTGTNGNSKWDLYARNTPEHPDNTPESLNYGDCRIAGETATVIFQSGMLAGKEFELMQTANSLSGYVHQERKFMLCSQEIDGQTMPNEIFKPVVGDTFRVFGVQLPDTYVCDDATQSGASWDMFREGAKYLCEHEEPEFSFTGELDGLWAKKDWLNIGGRIVPGGYILFSDPQFQPEGVAIRIVGIKDYINNPHSPEIELSNSVIGSSITSDLIRIDSNEVVTGDNLKKSLQYTRRSYRQAQETMAMLEKAVSGFGTSVTPLTVRTMQLLLGDESLQFEFVGSVSNPVPVPHNVSIDSAKMILTAPAGTIRHKTLGITSLAPAHAADQYRYWTLKEFKTPPLTDTNRAYYLYAKVSKADRTGLFRISEEAVALEGETGCYHLLLGVLSSEVGGARDFARFYGFSEITPGQITIPKIQDANANLVIDLLNSTITAKNGAKIRGQFEFSDGTSVEEAVDSLNTYVDGAFKDGMIDASEAVAIEKYINSINETKISLGQTYEALYPNPYLGGTPKSLLANAKIAFDAKAALLLDSITLAIEDGKTTVEEKAAVDNAYTAFIAAKGALNTRIEEANKAIQDAVKAGAVSDVTRDTQRYAGNFIASTETNNGIFLFNTNIPEKTNKTVIMDIDGYVYGTSGAFNITVLFYTYQTGLLNYSYVIHGEDSVDRIRIGVKNGKVALELKLKKDAYFPGFNVNIKSTYGKITVSDASGWTFSYHALALGDFFDDTYSNIITVPRHTTAAEDKAADALAKIATEEQARINAVAGVNASLGNLQNQLDGQVENWFYAYAPLANNFPADSWITEEQKRRHDGDTFTSVSQAPAPDAGKAWRWLKVNNVWGWQPIADSDAVKALLDAAKAQATADGKSTTFVAQPSNYHRGDTWILQADTTVNSVLYKKGDILNSSSDSATYIQSHWGKQVRYTDDTAADAAQGTADAAHNAATAAQNAANTALTTANAARATLDDWASDHKISPTEKTALRQQMADIAAEQAAILAQAVQYGVPAAAYAAAYAKAATALSKYTAATPANIAIDPDYDDIAAYYPARQTILDAIAAAAKSYADAASLVAANSVRDAIARNFGYEDFQKMSENAVSGGKTLINGGYINTELIKADALVANTINAVDDKNKSLVSIAPSTGLQLKKLSEGATEYTTTAEFTGAEIDSIESKIPDTPGNINISEVKHFLISKGSGTEIMATGTVAKDDSVTVSIPAIVVTPSFVYSKTVEEPGGGTKPPWEIEIPSIHNLTETGTPAEKSGDITLIPGGDIQPAFPDKSGFDDTYTLTMEFVINGKTYVRNTATFSKANIRCVPLAVGYGENPKYECKGTVTTPKLTIPAHEAPITQTGAGNISVKLNYSLTSLKSGGIVDYNLQIDLSSRFAESTGTGLVSKPLKVGGKAFLATFFGNGVLFAKSTDQYVGLLATPTGTQFIARSGKRGIKLDDQGFQQLTESGWDNSGLLCGYRVNSIGTILSRFGIKARTGNNIITNTAAGRYQINHNIGHTNYTTVPILELNNAGWCDSTKVLVTAANYAVIQINGLNSVGYDQPFQVTFFGKLQ